MLQNNTSALTRIIVLHMRQRIGVSKAFPMFSLTFCFSDKHIFYGAVRNALLCVFVNASMCREVCAWSMFLCTPLYMKMFSGWES